MKSTVKLRSLFSSTFFAVAALAALGVAGGCATSDDGQGEGEESVGEQAQALCCIEYTCPTTGYFTEGCNTGSMPGARAQCNSVCPVSCQAGVLECN